MPRRTLWVERVGTEGVVTDAPAHELTARSLAGGQDAIRPAGLVRQRRGWPYDGTTADVADSLVSVYRNKFVLNANTRTITIDDDGDFFVHNAAASGTSVYSGSVVYLARAVYRDQVLACAQDGVTPMRLWGGATAGVTPTTGAATWTDEQATITGRSWASAPARGSYTKSQLAAALTGGPVSDLRVTDSSTSSLTIEGIRAGTTDVVVGGTGITTQTGVVIPCVSIYDSGTINVSGGSIPAQVNGFGTDFSAAGVVVGDHILWLMEGGPTGYVLGQIISGISATTITSAYLVTDSTKKTYQIVRSCPFKDAASHKGSLWGTGVKQHKTRVYVGPPGWNLAFPPGMTLPHDPLDLYTTEVPEDYLMDFVDIPSPDDDDEIVAIVPSPNPLLALGRGDAWGIYGQYGSLDVTLLPEGHGAGCIDIRSAWELPIGPVWASEHGVLAFMGGRIYDLTKGRINNEWRSLVADFDYGVADRCVIGEADGVIRVHITTGAGATQRTWLVYPYDDGGRLNPSWFPVSNFNPTYMFSSKVPGEPQKLLAVDGSTHQGRVIDHAPVTSPDGDALDDDGTAPDLQLDLPANLPRIAGADVEERMLELVVEANLTDSAGTGSTLGGSVVSSEALDSDTPVTTSLTSMASKTTDAPKRYRHKVGVKATLHQVKLNKSATQATETKTEIARLGMTFRRSGRPV